MDISEIKKIVELMQEHDVSKFELEEEAFRLALVRGAPDDIKMVSPLPAAAAPLPVAAPAPAAAGPAVVAAEEDDGSAEIKSPIVGTFYRSSSPDADPLINVGDTVDKDTVVCIVEAMKVMNEIKAEVKGKITKILVENASPVVYGQPLFKITPQ